MAEGLVAQAPHAIDGGAMQPFQAAAQLDRFLQVSPQVVVQHGAELLSPEQARFRVIALWNKATLLDAMAEAWRSALLRHLATALREEACVLLLHPVFRLCEPVEN
jgi:hypothetical protein